MLLFISSLKVSCSIFLFMPISSARRFYLFDVGAGESVCWGVVFGVASCFLIMR